MNTIDFGLEIKAVTEEGEIEGYGAVLKNVDEVGDRLVPGVFTKTLAMHQKNGTRPLMLWNHNSDEPIGIWSDLVEDAKGLKVKGRIVLETARGKEVHALLKAGAIQGLSIGYRTKADAIENGVRVIKDLDLWEISPVSFAANGKARVTGVKSVGAMEEFARRLRDGEPPETKEFEDILRDAGVPKALATRIASVGYAKAIRSDSEGKAKDDTLRALRDAAAAFTSRT